MYSPDHFVKAPRDVNSNESGGEDHQASTDYLVAPEVGVNIEITTGTIGDVTNGGDEQAIEQLILTSLETHSCRVSELNGTQRVNIPSKAPVFMHSNFSKAHSSG